MGVRDGVSEMFEPDDEKTRYRRVSDIGRSDLFEALKSLAGFAENPFLVMQGAGYRSRLIWGIVRTHTRIIGRSGRTDPKQFEDARPALPGLDPNRPILMLSEVGVCL